MVNTLSRLVFLFLLVSCTPKQQPLPEIPVTKVFQPINLGQIKGVDTLFAANYAKELRAIPNEMCISGFAKIKGDFFPVAKKELEAGRQCIRVNLLWSDTHSYGDSDLKFIKSESARYDFLCRLFPDRKIEIAPFTEHNLKNPDKYLSVVKASAPNCKGYVNSVWNGSLTKNPAYKNEIHGNHKKPNIPGVKYNYSYDGTNSVDSDVPRYLQTYSDAEIFFVWNPRLNLKWSMKDETPRPQRNAIPSKEFLESLVYLFTDRGSVFIPKGWLVKSHSERHGVSDVKGDKLLIIGNVKGDKIFLKRDGKNICSCLFYGAYSEGGWRYYCSSMGYQCGKGLSLILGNKTFGLINGGFRLGSFR